MAPERSDQPNQEGLLLDGGPTFALEYDGSVKGSSAPSQYRGGNGGGAFLVDTSGTGYGLSVPELKIGKLNHA